MKEDKEIIIKKRVRQLHSGDIFKLYEGGNWIRVMRISNGRLYGRTIPGPYSLNQYSFQNVEIGCRSKQIVYSLLKDNHETDH